MTDAEIEHTEPDVWAAHAFLEQSRGLVRDGAVALVSPEGRLILLHTAAIAACDAILAANGYKIVGSKRGHQLRLETAERLLDEDLDDLFDRLDAARIDRNRVSYQAVPAPADIHDTLASVEELIARVDARVTPLLPPHLADRSG